MPRHFRSFARGLAIALLVCAAVLTGAVALMAHGEQERAVYRVRLDTAYGGMGGVACSWERPYRPTGLLALAWGRALGWLGLPGGRR